MCRFVCFVLPSNWQQHMYWYVSKIQIRMFSRFCNFYFLYQSLVMQLVKN